MCQRGCVPSEGSRGESSSLGCLRSLAHDLYLPSSKPAKWHPQISLFRLSFSVPPLLPESSSDSDPFAFSFKDPRDYTGPPGHSSPSQGPALNHTCKVPIKPHKAAWPLVSEIRMWTTGGRYFTHPNTCSHISQTYFFITFIIISKIVFV